MVIKQFFDRPFFITLLAHGAVFGLAVGAFEHPALPLLLAAGGLLIAGITFHRPEYGIAIAFAELFANSHGHLLSVELGGFAFGLRMVVFAAVMGGWGARLLVGRSRLDPTDPRLLWFLPLFGAIAIGFSAGFAHDPRAAFADGNAYVYLAYLFPILSVEWNAVNRRLLLQVFAASAAWVSLLTLGIVYVFSHVPEWRLGAAYRFIRDTRTGELTKMTEGIFRVFLQAQVSAAVAIFLFTPFLWMKSLPKRDLAAAFGFLSLCVAAVLVSLSRSFWVGLTIASVLWVALVLRFMRPGLKEILRGIALTGAAKAAAVALIVFVLFFPFPRITAGSVSDLAGLFSARSTDFGGDAAIDSRWKLLPPMIERIGERPIAGSGFGTQVEFVTDDPRIRAERPDGRWSTAALEWGWLELWIKMGILGPVAFLVLGAFLVRGLWDGLATKRAWLSIGFISALAFLFVTHVFSPYLNHPLGLGFLLFLIPFVQRKNTAPRGGTALILEDLHLAKRPQPSMAPLTSE